MPDLNSTDQIKAYFQANAVLEETERYRQLSRYASFFDCEQYAHQTSDWWGMTADQMETVSSKVLVPSGFEMPGMDLKVRQKRPTAPYHLGRAIPERFTGLLFSEERRPTIDVEGDPDTADLLNALIEQACYWSRMSAARNMGGSMGAVLITVHLQKGKLSIEVHDPRHVQMLWKDRKNLEPQAALICYRYAKEEITKDEKTGEVTAQIVTYLSRRIITDQDDTIYKDVKLEDNATIEWEVESTATHGLGYFPGVWVQNLPVEDDEDGVPDCHGAWQIFDTIDRMDSQINKALLNNLDPTLVVKTNPQEVAQQGGSIRKGSENALYVGASGNANYMEMTGQACEVAGKYIDRKKQQALDITRCVLVDPQTIAGAAQSARAIEYIYAPMLEKAGDLRTQYGSRAIIPTLKTAEDLARKYHDVEMTDAEGKAVVAKLDLPPKADGTPRKLGAGGWIKMTWGRYFAPTVQDQQVGVANAVAAKSGGIIDATTAVQQGAALFNVQDPKAMQAKIEQERQSQLDEALSSGPYGAADLASRGTTPPASQGVKP